MNRSKTILLAPAFTLGCAASASPHHHDHHDHHGETPAHHHGFKDAEQWAKRFDDPARDAWQKPSEVVALMRIEPGMTVADLGAGTGYFLPYLVPAVGPDGAVVALDIEPDMVRYLSERAAREGWSNVSAKQVAPDDPGLASASVDRVLIVDTWHHIDARDAYTQKLAAALKPGGELVIVDFTKDSPEGPPVQHRLPPEEIVKTFEGAGLEAKIVEETLPRQFVVIGRRR